MKYLMLSMLVVLAFASTRATFAAEDLQSLQNSLSVQTGLLAKAQSRLNNAESSLKSNTEALTRTKIPNDQKALRGYISVSQGIVAKERSEIVVIQRELENINQRIAVIQQGNQAPIAKIDPATQVAAGAAKPAAAKTLHTVVMKDGRKLECVRFMEVDEQYALQMPDKKIENVKKDDVVEIISP